MLRLCLKSKARPNDVLTLPQFSTRTETLSLIVTSNISWNLCSLFAQCLRRKDKARGMVWVQWQLNL